MAAKISRTKAREQAFILLFEQLFHKECEIEELIEEAEQSLDTTFHPYALFLIKSIMEDTDKIDDIFKKHLKGWSAERISKVSIVILRIAVFEYFFCDSVPQSVAINEAVVLMKKYSDQKDSAFVNGVLSSVSKEHGITLKQNAKKRPDQAEKIPANEQKNQQEKEQN